MSHAPACGVCEELNMSSNKRMERRETNTKKENTKERVEEENTK
jgi:hypothetical protein